MSPRDPLVRSLGAALVDGGLNVIASADAAGWPGAGALLDGARSVIVVGSGGRALWSRFRAWSDEAPRARLLDEAHPLDRYVGTVLDRGDALLAAAGVRARRFEPTVVFEPRVDFRRLATLAGLGASSPLGIVVHPVFGPWWALRGAWLIDRALPPTPPLVLPCEGCASAPCRAAIPDGTEGTILAAIFPARAACRIQEHRYTDEQIAWHLDFQAARRRLAALHGVGA